MSNRADQREPWAAGALVVLVSAAAMLTACGGASATSIPITKGRHLIVAVDLSGSRSDAAVHESKKLLRVVADSLAPGDKITLLHVEGRGRQPGNGKSFTFPQVQRSDKLTARVLREVEGTREDIRAAVMRLFDGASSLDKNETDILSTLFTVSDHLAESEGKQATLVLLSDMIQDGNGHRFDQPAGIPSASWIDQQKSKNRLPSLSGLCVSAVGPDASTIKGMKIRDFWQHHFEAAGADFSTDRYRQTVTRFESLLCRGR